MRTSAIILSGGASKRFGTDKGLVELLGKPLILYVHDSVLPLVDEVIIVLSSEAQLKKYQDIVKSSKLIIDEHDLHAPIIGALTGFKNALGDYSILLSCDTPLISQKVVSLLLDLAPENDAVVPRWPNRYIEPLQAAYRTKTAYSAAMEAVKNGKLRLSNMIEGLQKILYISTMSLYSLDPNLNTFLNVNTQVELKKAENIIKLQKSLP